MLCVDDSGPTMANDSCPSCRSSLATSVAILPPVSTEEYPQSQTSSVKNTQQDTNLRQCVPSCRIRAHKNRLKAPSWQKAVVLALSCVVLLLPSSSIVDAQRFYYGQCPRTVPTAPNFDLKRYLGVWYDVERYPSPMHAWGSCWSSTYQLQERDNSVDLLVGGILYLPSVRRGGRLYQELRNDLWNFDMTQPAKFQYRVKDVPRVFRNFQAFNGEYQVVDTDYDNWAIEWRCTNWALGVRSEMLYIMSRRPQLENTTMTYVKRRLAEYKILDMEPLQRVNQGCTERRTSPTLG